ncbi:NAD(P)/FAD-dependent oxidoreductase [Phreatobacter aquaticus]|uniref:NAD(P)/FAD-dependent oxidoreductase n=1 Tax=Phreatobacter aquaticus TaxID=2570229 RepID=A0A4D7QGX7_9HYPH|nr:NAD(P)/FAD-dependent oxidoreductase [Phreatobacter aquaticus]QCK86145.1 NAD(P)/FAD-dependent oxidoreductase [Phreatobacter aquaticus]
MSLDPLAALEARIADDLGRIAHPAAPWLKPRSGPDGSKALDVLIVGGGQSGVVTAFGLKRMRVDNVLVVDKAAYGQEGPWVTYARMKTLRSPKDFTGPDLDIPSLTYQSWHEAKYGVDHWRALDLITREDWNDYLLFVRKVTGVKVENATELTGLSFDRGLIRAELSGPEGTRSVYARKVVLATGQDSTGRWWMPSCVEALPTELRAHAADPIDFDRLKGKVVAVLGAGASAFDNAATALEAGAAEVHLFCRRIEPQVIQPYRWLTFRGFLKHFSDLDDVWRWRFMSRVLGLREGFPQATYDRCARHANFTVHTDAPWLDARVDGDRAVVTLPQGEFAADFLIAGTGIAMDFGAKPELASFADNILSWADAYQPPEAERNDRLGGFPYLSEHYAFVEKQPGLTPWIRDVHLFSIASTMSFGASGSSINAMTTAVPRLIDGITRGLFCDDVESHWADFLAYDIPQATVQATVPGLGREAAE